MAFTSTSNSSTTSYASSEDYEYFDIKKIIDEAYQAGFEDGGNAMNRLLNGTEKSDKTKNILSLLETKLITWIRSYVNSKTKSKEDVPPYYVPYEYPRYEGYTITSSSTTTAGAASVTGDTTWVDTRDRSLDDLKNKFLRGSV